jgi:hypothetical protein
MIAFHSGSQVFDLSAPFEPNVSAWPTHPPISGNGAPARVLLGSQT